MHPDNDLFENNYRDFPKRTSSLVTVVSLERYVLYSQAAKKSNQSIQVVTEPGHEHETHSGYRYRLDGNSIALRLPDDPSVFWAALYQLEKQGEQA